MRDFEIELIKLLLMNITLTVTPVTVIQYFVCMIYSLSMTMSMSMSESVTSWLVSDWVSDSINESGCETDY